MPFHRRLYRVAYHLTGNAQDAEDLLQDTYLRLWQKRNDLRDETMTEAYLVRLMQNLHIDEQRLKHIDSSETIDDHANAPDERNLSETIDAEDEVRQINVLIDGLPERNRNILRMHLIEEKSYEEIQRDTGLSQGNIRIIMMRTRIKLKKQFEEFTKIWTN